MEWAENGFTFTFRAPYVWFVMEQNKGWNWCYGCTEYMYELRETMRVITHNYMLDMTAGKLINKALIS